MSGGEREVEPCSGLSGRTSKEREVQHTSELHRDGRDAFVKGACADWAAGSSRFEVVVALPSQCDAYH